MHASLIRIEHASCQQIKHIQINTIHNINWIINPICWLRRRLHVATATALLPKQQPRHALGCKCICC